jgi:hypothetical protein
MPLPRSAKGSTETSNSLFDLDLPVVLEGEGPQPVPAASYELVLAHARFLIDSGLSSERQPNPEPFVFD